MLKEGTADYKKPETLIAPEIPRTDWDTILILQRHGAYDTKRPVDSKNPTEEEIKSLGRLTPEGKEDVKKITRKRLGVVMENQPEKTDFLLINSPTYWLDNEKFGQRARETSEIVAEEIKNYLKEKGLPDNQLLNTLQRESGKSIFRGGVSRPEKRLGEALMFQVPEFADFLRKEYKGQGPDFWKNFNLDTHKEKREQYGAEGPVEIADRMNKFITVVARFASAYHKKHPGRKLLSWKIAHGDSLEPYVQRVLGVPEEAFNAGYNAGIGISINAKGEAKTTIEDKDYKVNFIAHGKPAPLQSTK